MLAVALSEHGAPSVLRLCELPEPSPGPHEVCVRVVACALNRLDLWVRAGLPGLRLTYPHILGSDVSGVIESVGPGCAPGLVGSEVVVNPGTSCGRCEACLSGWDNLCPRYAILGEHRSGGYAQRIVVPEANVVAKPNTLTMVEAAAIPLTFLTAWQMLVVRAHVQPGDVVLLHAVGSGVGVAALQIAKLHGAIVIALASSDAKLERARALGADAVVRSDVPDWESRIRELPCVGKRGVDIVVEHTGATTWEASIRLTRRGGTITTCGATSGPIANTDLRHVFFRQLQILGSTMGSKSLLYRILPLVERGVMRAVVDRTFPLEQAADAHAYLDRREQFGKVVLEIPS